LVLGSSDDALTICVLDDEQAMVEMLQESLRCLGFSSIGTATAKMRSTWSTGPGARGDVGHQMPAWMVCSFWNRRYSPSRRVRHPDGPDI